MKRNLFIARLRWTFLKDRLEELEAANHALRSQYEEIEAQLKITSTKLHMAEKANTTMEEENDKVR